VDAKLFIRTKYVFEAMGATTNLPPVVDFYPFIRWRDEITGEGEAHEF
jgi:hypothetical protein